MAIPKPVISDSVSGSDLMQGMVGNDFLLQLKTNDYDDITHTKIKLKPNHELYGKKMGGAYIYKAVLLYMDATGINFDAKTGLAKINKSEITKALRSEKETFVDNRLLRFDVITKDIIERYNPIAKDFNSIVIALLPYRNTGDEK